MKMSIILEGGGQETVMQAAPIGRGKTDETTALVDVHHNGLDTPDTKTAWQSAISKLPTLSGSRSGYYLNARSLRIAFHTSPFHARQSSPGLQGSSTRDDS